MITASTTALKVGAALGTLAVAGASAATVAVNQKPGGAPLRPPVAGATPAPAASADTLSIPLTPVCERSPGARPPGCRATRGALPAAPGDDGGDSIAASVTAASPDAQPVVVTGAS